MLTFNINETLPDYLVPVGKCEIAHTGKTLKVSILMNDGFMVTKSFRKWTRLQAWWYKYLNGALDIDAVKLSGVKSLQRYCFSLLREFAI